MVPMTNRNRKLESIEEEDDVITESNGEVDDKSKEESTAGCPNDYDSTSSAFPDSFTFFSLERRNAQRKWIVNYLYERIRSESESTNLLMTFVIKSVHFIAPFLMAAFAVTSSIWVVIILFVSLFVIKFLFWYLNGCFLSNLEYKMYKNLDVNVVDPLVVAFGRKVSKESRVDITIKATNLLMTFLAAVIIWKGEKGELST